PLPHQHPPHVRADEDPRAAALRLGKPAPHAEVEPAGLAERADHTEIGALRKEQVDAESVIRGRRQEAGRVPRLRRERSGAEQEEARSQDRDSCAHGSSLGKGRNRELRRKKIWGPRAPEGTGGARSGPGQTASVRSLRTVTTSSMTCRNPPET